MDTKEKIKNQALEMFNERGIEYVGLREIAATLNIRVSNITYYFPTKDDLVNALAMELFEHNSNVMVESDTLTMTGFLRMLYEVFQNQTTYRCLLLSIVHIMKQNKALSARYKKTVRRRNETLRANIEALTNRGYLKPPASDYADLLIPVLALLNRFWISEAMVLYRDRALEKQLQHYITLVAKLLLPYSTAKGKKEIEQFVSGL